MSEVSEQEIRDNIAKWSVGRERRALPWTQKRFAFLLDLLDAERAKVARHEEPFRVQPPSSSLRPMQPGQVSNCWALPHDGPCHYSHMLGE